MGNNYVKQLGIKPDGRIGTKEFNSIWSKYADKDNTMRKKNAVKFLKDFAGAAGVKGEDAMIDQLLVDAGVTSDTSQLTKEVFMDLFFASAKTKHTELTKSVLAYKQKKIQNSKQQVGGGNTLQVPSPSPSPSPLQQGQQQKNSDSQLAKPVKQGSLKGGPTTDPLIDALFNKYASEENADVIDPNGLVAFLTDIDIAPNDIALLVLGYHMKATVMGVFTRDEFVGGLTKLKINSIDAIKTAIPHLRMQIKNNLMYQDIYKFSFKFYKEDPNHKFISLETADMVLEMIANDKPQIPRFRKFLHKQKEYKVLNMDQWTNLFDFMNTVGEDLEEYTENGCWPFIFDLYVEWVKEGHTGDSAEEEPKKEKKKDEYDFDF